MAFRARILATAAAAAGLLLGVTARVQAQTTAPAPITAGWNDGFVIQSADGDNRIAFGVTLQADDTNPLLVHLYDNGGFQIAGLDRD